MLNIIVPTYPSTGSEANGFCDIMEYKGGIPLSLAQYGQCPTKEFIMGALAKEDFGEFSHDEMCCMIEGCYA